MKITTAARLGDFCWVDHATTALEQAREFYTALFGWTIRGDADASPEFAYDHVSAGDGGDFGGIYKMQKEQMEAGIPPHWLNYILSDSIEASIAKVTELGGAVHFGPIDVGAAGRLAVCNDPTGASFAFWQAKSHAGKAFEGAIGEPCWFELMTTDSAKAQAFYEALLGWTSESMDMGEAGTYTMFANGGQPLGGMMQMGEEFGGAPPHWATYFAVESCDATTAKAEELGGKAYVPPTDIPGKGRFALLADPVGATFAVYQNTAGGS